MSAGPQDWGTEENGQPLLGVTWASCLLFLSMEELSTSKLCHANPLSTPAWDKQGSQPAQGESLGCEEQGISAIWAVAAICG